MKPPRVFVVHNAMRSDGDGGLVAKYDLSPASAHGTLVYLLGPSASPFSPEVVLPEMARKLMDYDGQRDFLLCVGNPILIGWAFVLAAHADPGHNVSALQWSGTQRGYVPVQADLSEVMRRILYDCSEERFEERVAVADKLAAAALEEPGDDRGNR